MIRRPPHGATRRPPLDRPGSGYGRPVRPRPSAQRRDVKALSSARSWEEIEVLLGNATGATSDGAAVNA